MHATNSTLFPFQLVLLDLHDKDVQLVRHVW